MKNSSNLAFSLLASFALAACGGTDAVDDPLAGTWTNSECFGASSKPADIESCSTELTFTDALDITLQTEWISLAATATNPGCTTTKIASGQTWSASHADGTFTVSGDGSATMERSNCVDPADDSSAESTTDIAIPSGDHDYEISGDTLTIKSGALQGVYTR